MKECNNVVSLSNMNIGMYIILFLVGMIAAATMVIPGISGSFVLMLLGYYEPIVNTIRDLTDFSLLGHNLLVLIPFGIGIIIGIVLIAKLIEYLLNKYPVKTYYRVLGFIIASLVAIIKPMFSISPTIIEVIISTVLVVIGGIVAYKLGDK